MSGAAHRELRSPAQAVLDAHQTDARERQRRALAGLGLRQVGEAIDEDRTAGNVFALGAGAYGGARIEAPYGRIVGLSDSRIERQAVFRENTVVSGVVFRSSRLNEKRNNADALVRIENAARVIFSACTFEKEPDDRMSAVAADRLCFVVVENGARAHFIGCVFRPTMTQAGLVVNHVAGPAADVYIIGCVNSTGQAHGGVTIIAETT